MDISRSRSLSARPSSKALNRILSPNDSQQSRNFSPPLSGYCYGIALNEKFAPWPPPPGCAGLMVGAGRQRLPQVGKIHDREHGRLRGGPASSAWCRGSGADACGSRSWAAMQSVHVPYPGAVELAVHCDVQLATLHVLATPLSSLLNRLVVLVIVPGVTTVPASMGFGSRSRCRSRRRRRQSSSRS